MSVVYKRVVFSFSISRAGDRETLMFIRNRHYFYKLKGEYSIVSTPKGGWFRSKPSSSQALAVEETPRPGHHYPSSLPRVSVKRAKKQIILSQSMVIDADLNKVGRPSSKKPDVSSSISYARPHRKATVQKP